MDNSQIDEIESGAASFLTGNDSLAALVDKMLLDVYTAEDEESSLFLEGCDDEQIFQQIEVLHNNKILEEAENEEFEVFEPSDNEDEDGEENVSEDGEEVLENDDRETEENEGDDFAGGESEDEEGIEGLEDIEEDDGDFDEDEAEEKLSQQASKIYGKTEIDDKFFSLREMEEICDEQEKNEEVDLDEEMLDELYGDGGGDGKDLFGKYDFHRYQGVDVRQEVYRWH